MKVFKVLAVILLASFAFQAASAQVHHRRTLRVHHKRHHMMIRHNH